MDLGDGVHRDQRALPPADYLDPLDLEKRGPGKREPTGESTQGVPAGGVCRVGAQTNQICPSETSAALFLFNQPAAPAGDVWARDLYQEGPAYAPGARPMEIQTGTKLFISNLDYNVSNDDVKVLSTPSVG